MDIRIQDLVKSFDNPDKPVLKGLTVDINGGEFVSITGRSGSGKSTFLYCVSGLDTISSGTVSVGGRDIHGMDPAEIHRFRNEEMGFVFQFHYLLPEFTVLKNVMLPALKLNEQSPEEIEHHAMEKLRILGMDNQAMKRANQISGGQKQRVAIARALINNPLIIMGDEPTGNLDSKNSQNVFNIFRELCEEVGQSLLIVTHDHDFAAKTDRIITMEDGRIIGDDRLR